MTPFESYVHFGVWTDTDARFWEVLTSLGMYGREVQIGGPFKITKPTADLDEAGQPIMVALDGYYWNCRAYGRLSRDLRHDPETGQKLTQEVDGVKLPLLDRTSFAARFKDLSKGEPPAFDAKMPEPLVTTGVRIFDIDPRTSGIATPYAVWA
jgi:hypothetical protein